MSDNKTIELIHKDAEQVFLTRQYLVKFAIDEGIRKAFLVKVTEQDIKDGLFGYVKNIVAEGEPGYTTLEFASLINPFSKKIINGISLLCDENGLAQDKEVTCSNGHNLIVGTAVAVNSSGEATQALHLHEVLNFIDELVKINMHASFQLGTGDVDLSPLIKATKKVVKNSGFTIAPKRGR